jgi:hypothetical protein
VKIFVAIYIWTVLLAGSLSLAGPRDRSKDLIVEEGENVFVLKASRKFKGAEIEVVSASGYVVVSRRLTKRKFVIDFQNIVNGTYSIRVKKGARKQEFKFTKK